MSIKTFFQGLYDWLARLGRYVKNLIIDIFTDAVKDFVNKMGPTIEQILLTIQEDPSCVLDGDRRETAYKMIVEAAKKAGIEVIRDSVVYMAIEMILQALKNTGKIGENVGATGVKSKKKKPTKKTKSKK